MKITHVLQHVVHSILCGAVFTAWGYADTLSNLATRGDAIVIGTVTTRSESGIAVSFDIQIEKVFKGTISPGSVHVAHQWIRRGIIAGFPQTKAGQTIDAQLHGIWFLQRAAGPDWEILAVSGQDGIMVNLYSPAAVTLPPAYQYSETTSLVDSLILEVAAGLEAEGWRPAAALDALGSLRTPAASMFLTNYVNSLDPAFRSIGLAGLLTQSHQDAIAQLVRFWPSISEAPSRVRVIQALRDSFRDSTPSAVQQLVAVATADSIYLELSPAAVTALAAIHTRESLPFLAHLLLSSDPGEQMKGVFGLSSFVNGCPSQTPNNVASMEYLQFKNPSPYRTAETIAKFAFRRGLAEQETDLVSFWLNWWKQNGMSLE